MSSSVSNGSRRWLALHAWAVYLFLYAPILILVVFSFNAAKSTSVWEGFSLRWYRELWNDDVIQKSVRVSVGVSLLSTIISTIIGTMAALALSRVKWFGKTATAALLFLPVIIPEIVIGAALLSFFSATTWRLSFWTVLIAHVAFSVSYVAIVVRARLAGFDHSLEEAAMDLGAAPLGMFRRVKLPLMMPGVLAGALLAFTISVDDYVITSFVAGPESTTLPLLIASMLKTKEKLPVVNASATVLLLFTVVLIVAAQRLLADKTKSGTDR